MVDSGAWRRTCAAVAVLAGVVLRDSRACVRGEFTSTTCGRKLKLIPAGEFQMGSSKADDPDAEADETPRHRVRITRPFYLGVTEVTQGQFRRHRREPEFFQSFDGSPVEQALNDISFPQMLSEREGLKPYYRFGAGTQSGGDGYRLPREAE